MRGLSSARRRPPANRRGVRLPRKAYIVRSRYTYTYTPLSRVRRLGSHLRSRLCGGWGCGGGRLRRR